MTAVPCPICKKRLLDSNKSLMIAKLSKNNEKTADIVVKCQQCKNCLAIKISRDIIE